MLFVLGIIFTSNATSIPKTTTGGLTSYKGKKFEGPLVIKATGQQWLWRYNYPNGSFSYYKLVIPVHTEIELKLDSTDVIHTWNVPDLAPKTEAVPGKNTDLYFRADAEGYFFGQASTLSGQAYAPMRTDVEVVSPERFEQFIVEQQKDIKKAQESAEKIDEENKPEPEEGSRSHRRRHGRIGYRRRTDRGAGRRNDRRGRREQWLRSPAPRSRSTASRSRRGPAGSRWRPAPTTRTSPRS